MVQNRIITLMTHEGLISLCGGIGRETPQSAGGVHNCCHAWRAQTCLSGWRHPQHLELHLEARLGLSGLAFDQHLVLSEPDQGLIREVRPLQVAQRRAVNGQPALLAQVLDGEQRVFTVRGAVRMQGELFARHPRVHQRKGAGPVVPSQP